MPFKTILAIIQSAEDAERVSDCAGALAARHEAYLIGLHAEALPIPYTSTIGFPDAEFIQASTEVNQERSKKIEAIFRQHTAKAGITAEWRSLESFSGDSAHSGIADCCRSCDLVVAAQAGSDGASPDVDALLYDTTPGPVLVHPARRAPRLIPPRDRRLERQPRGLARRFRRAAAFMEAESSADPAFMQIRRESLQRRRGRRRHPARGARAARRQRSPSTPKRRAASPPTAIIRNRVARDWRRSPCARRLRPPATARDCSSAASPARSPANHASDAPFLSR